MVSPPQVSNPSVEASLPHSSSKLMFSLLLLLLPGAWTPWSMVQVQTLNAPMIINHKIASTDVGSNCR